MVRQALALAIIIGALQVAHTHGQEPRGPATSQPVSRPEVACIDLNDAPANALVELPGIGPARAEAIVEARSRRRFRRIEEILRVPGIGRKTFGRIRHRLCVE